MLQLVLTERSFVKPFPELNHRDFGGPKHHLGRHIPDYVHLATS